MAKMRTIRQCLNLSKPSMMTIEEDKVFREWLDKEARYSYDGADYCYLLGWYTVGENIPLSPKEAGFD